MALLSPTVTRSLQTIICLLTMLSAGMTQGILSPALPDLQYLTESTTSQISLILVVSGLGCAVGSLAGGPLFDKYDGFVCLSIATFLQAVLFSAVPFCTHLVGVAGLFTLGAMPNFAIFSGSFALTIKIWRDFPAYISPFIQTMDLMHALGLALIPVIIQPFLGDFRNSSATMTFEDIAEYNKTVLVFPGVGYNIHTAFLILGSMDMTVVFFCLAGIALKLSGIQSEDNSNGGDPESTPLLEESSPNIDTESVGRTSTSDNGQSEDHGDSVDSLGRKSVLHQKDDLRRALLNRRGSLPAKNILSEQERRGSFPAERMPSPDGRRQDRRASIALSIIRRASRDAGKPLFPKAQFSHHMKQYRSNKWLFIVYLTTGFIFFVVNGGRDIILVGLLYSYVTKFLDFSTKTGTLLVTVYHMIRTFGHIVIIIIAKCVRPLWVGVADMIFLLGSSMILMFTYDKSNISIWVCICVTAMATSNIYPTSLSIVEDTMPVTAKISGFLFCGMSLGMMTFSASSARLMETAGAVSVPLFLVISSCACTILSIPLILVGRKLKVQPEVLMEIPVYSDHGKQTDNRGRVVTFKEP